MIWRTWEPPAVVLAARQPVWWWAGPLPAVGRWVGRRPRSSPGVREARAWRRGPASPQPRCWNAGRALVNTDELEAATYVARRRVLEIQAKLHRWARDDPHRRFDDVFN